jgi:hypothetical protein
MVVALFSHVGRDFWVKFGNHLERFQVVGRDFEAGEILVRRGLFNLEKGIVSVGSGQGNDPNQESSELSDCELKEYK